MDTDAIHLTVAGRPSRWPVIWGTVAIVLAVIALVAEAARILQAAATIMLPLDAFLTEVDISPSGDPVQDRMMEDMMLRQEEIMTATAKLAPWNLAIGTVLLLLAIVLLTGGILLCLRSRKAAPVLQTWAVLKIVAGGFGVWIAHRATNISMRGMGDMIDSFSAISASPATTLGGVLEWLSLAILILGLLWTLWLPVFFLVWFNRPVVREDMNSGPGWPPHPPAEGY